MMKTINENGVMPVDDEIEYSVSFILDEKDNKVYLNSRDEKKKYIKNENHFCLKEYDKFFTTINKDRRKKLKIELEKKRMAFAIHSGFQEVANSGVWNHRVVNDAKEIA